MELQQQQGLGVATGTYSDGSTAVSAGTTVIKATLGAIEGTANLTVS